jgi:methionyl-tRNA formyltransferase
MGKFRICFAGTPAFAAAHLSALINSHHDVVSVFTQPDRPSGRGKKLQASAVKQVAMKASIPVLQPASLKSTEQQSMLREVDPDLLVVVAFGLILPKEFLDIPRCGCINVHASLLPRWRGAAPIERALLAGDKETGVTIMQMDEGLDTGNILYKVKVEISDSDSRVDLEKKLCEAGQDALLHTLEQFETLVEQAQVQHESEATYAKKIEKSEALIDWSKSAEEIDRLIRAGIGRLPAYSFLGEHRLRVLQAAPSVSPVAAIPGTIVKVNKDHFQVACQESSLIVDSVQLPGRNPMSVRDVNNSRPGLFKPGLIFTAVEAER